MVWVLNNVILKFIQYKIKNVSENVLGKNVLEKNVLGKNNQIISANK